MLSLKKQFNAMIKEYFKECDDDDSYSDYFEDDDDLATFTINDPIKETKGKKTSAEKKDLARWVAPGGTIKIKGKTITKGFFYYGTKLETIIQEYFYFKRETTEASLVNDSLKIIFDKKNTDDIVSYHEVKFDTFSPKSRGAYINWLASDRSDPKTPIKYVYLYFFGLERRILIDNQRNDVSDLEFKNIFDELHRLYHLFNSNKSFQNSLANLIELMRVLRYELLKEHLNPNLLINHPLDFRILLALAVHDKKTISPELALLWINNCPYYNLRTAAKRCEDVFSTFFIQSYKAIYDKGFKIKPNKKKFQFEYYPRSSSLNPLNINECDFADPSELKAPIKKLISIADECTQQLNAYSRHINNKGVSKDELSAILLLPELALNADAHTLITQFRSWLSDKIIKNNGLILVSEFLLKINPDILDKLNKKQIDSIRNLAQKAGYGFAPDPRYHLGKPTLKGHIILFKGSLPENYIPSNECKVLEIILHLSAMTSQVNSLSHSLTFRALNSLIDQNSKLSRFDKSSLHAYLSWCLHSPINMAGLKLQIEKRTNIEKEHIRHSILEIAFIDPQISPQKIKQLEKIYSLLKLNKSLLLREIHQFSTSKKRPSIVNNIAGDKTTFSLNEDILALHEIETKNVQNMLAEIFSDDKDLDIKTEELEKQCISNDVADPADMGKITGLDSAHARLYQTLIEQESWLRKDVIELCKKSGLMIDGALEIINDWSFEQTDAPVLNEDGDDLYVDQEIVAELKG